MIGFPSSQWYNTTSVLVHEVSMTGTTRHAKTPPPPVKGRPEKDLLWVQGQKWSPYPPICMLHRRSPHMTSLKLGDIAARKGIPRGAVGERIQHA